MTHLTRDLIDYHALTERVRSPHCGAVVLFLGTVRDLTGDQVTEFLDYEAYEPMAEAKLAQLEAEALTKWPIGAIAILHRLGRLGVSEVSVAVAVSSPHRAAAFDAARWAMDRVKEVVPVWKKDQPATGPAEWHHPGEV